MTIYEAKEKVNETNPNAIWVISSYYNGNPDSYDVFDFTYSDEVKARIYQFDILFGNFY